MKLLRTIMLCVLMFAGCAKKVQVNAPTLDQLVAAEGVSCTDLTAADVSQGLPAVDCKRVYDAYVRGRLRMTAIYPAAAGVKMSNFFFYRPKLYFAPEKPYPLISLTGDGQNLVRGVTSSVGLILMQYSYPECLEHEAAHAIGRLLDGGMLRTPEAIAADADQATSLYFYQILCHGTSDDPLGERGLRTSCVVPYPDAPWAGFKQP